MFYYIQKDLITNYIQFTDELDEINYLIGETIEDYTNGFFIKLNEEQINFIEKNPTATAIEIFNMELNIVIEPTLTLEEVKEKKLQEIDSYDNSASVNNFKINNIIDAWFTVAERNNYCASINAAKTMSVDILSFYVGDIKLEIGTAMAEMMLAQIQLYADQCFIVTKQHKINVEALTTVEEVNDYDFTVGYPEQLNFQLG